MNKQITLGGSILLTLSAPVINSEAIRLETVLESEDWAALKNIWRMANRVKPSEILHEFPVATEKGDSLNTVVGTLFSETDYESSQVMTAVSMIKRMTQTRIMRLSRINMTMLTRMIPPWTLIVRDNQLFNFENRIFTLTRLADAGEITASEFITARDTLLDRAETLAVLEILEDVYEQDDYGYFTDPVKELGTEIILQRLALSYRAALDTLSKQSPSEHIEHYQVAVQQYEEFLEKYSEFERVEPVFRILLTDLMEAEI